ncbi:cell death abnormality protein 8-like [Actinia tenebrosa]|uniref:XK-related protein n=1 Tax=Actinia tenebrosa TaxID=6105 RepID=A0A6P8H1H8_ACTTE|nr:cell death abnormality protein 8-like [Actinia tenebrosa]
MKNQTVLDEELTMEELTDKEIKTVEKFNRQLSRHSILSIRTEDGLDELETEIPEVYDREAPIVKETITQEEAFMMKNVLRAFGYVQESEILEKDTKADRVDGSKIYRWFSSSESYDTSYYELSSSHTSRFISPGRFYVSEETKAIIREVHQKIVQRKPCSSTSYERQILVKVQSQVTSEGVKLDDIGIEMANEELKNETSGHPSNGVGPSFGINNPEFCDSRISLLSDPNISNARNGHVGYTDLSRLPPRERFQELTRRALARRKEEEKRKKREFYTRLWEKRGKAGWLDLIFTIIGFGAFFADTGTDIKVASDHFTTGDPWWGTFTLILVIFPAILVNLVSYFFYKEDEGHGRVPESGWKAVKITHICQVGLVERYWQILVKGYQIKFKKLRETLHYELYIAMNLDVAMLQMILAFTEDAPQLVLQLYVLIRRHLVETLQTSRIQDLWTIASIFFSFISYSRATVNYISCLRNSKKHKGVLRWYGYISMLLWRSLMFISRILVLVFFASEFHIWFFLVLFLHFVIVFALMKSQKVGFFPGQKPMQFFIRVVIAYIHTFCFFVLDAAKTIKWAIIYYSLTAIEAIIFCSLWFTNAYREISLKLELAGLSVIFISYTLGLLMMVVYYKFLHPKFKRPQTKWYTKKAIPKEELCEEVEDEEEKENEEEEKEQEEGEGGEADQVQTNLDHLARNRASNIVKQFAVWV